MTACLGTTDFPTPCLLTHCLLVPRPNAAKTFAQVFATSYGCSRTIPMTKKRDAPFALGRLFRHEGAPPEIIIDGSKEQNLGDIASKLRDAVCHRKQIEPHSPWMNLCEGEIRELKCGLTRKRLHLSLLLPHTIQLYVLP